MTQKIGVGLNKEEGEKVRGFFNYDELWEYLQDQGISDMRITRLDDRINAAIKKAVEQEMI